MPTSRHPSMMSPRSDDGDLTCHAARAGLWVIEIASINLRESEVRMFATAGVRGGRL